MGQALFGKDGAWEKSSGGTLYLDEISQLGEESQRMLAEKLSKPGAPADVWVLASTNGDLSELVRQGKIRSDLYAVFGSRVLRLPPLRDRKQDLPFLAQHFIETFKVLTGSPAEKLSTAAICQLMTYPWPGNIRELETSVERACLLAKGLEIGDLDIPVSAPRVQKLEELLQTTEKAFLVDALARNQGHLGKTAESVNMGIKTLQRKMRKYGLALKDFRGLDADSTNPVPSEN